jgi:hypothetical protein
VAAAVFLVSLAAGFAWSARKIGDQSQQPAAPAAARKPAPKRPALPTPPKEIRGIHITMDLANVPGRYREYLKVPGLNTIELDLKDESGHVAYPFESVPLARKVHAASLYFRPQLVAREAHDAGMYLVGRVVTFEDPILAAAHPELALHNADGSLWHTNGGLGWLNPYDKRAWDYAVSIGAAAARAGFDEIQFDYVRFPTDGDVSKIKYPVRVHEPKAKTIARFIRYATTRLHPLGVRVSADVFGLSATRDLGIGQRPGKLARAGLDAVYPMVYPSHFYSGEYGLNDPNANPGQTVTDALLYFETQLQGTNTRLVPWLQDFSLGRTYTYDDVAAQIDAVRALGLHGWMLWNPLGEYTQRALTRP